MPRLQAPGAARPGRGPRSPPVATSCSPACLAATGVSRARRDAGRLAPRRTAWRRDTVDPTAAAPTIQVLASSPPRSHPHLPFPQAHRESETSPETEQARWHGRAMARGSGRGWQGYPGSRLVMDAAGRDLLGFLRDEISSGQLDAEARVLHIARSYQPWASLPIAVFTLSLIHI